MQDQACKLSGVQLDAFMTDALQQTSMGAADLDAVHDMKRYLKQVRAAKVQHEQHARAIPKH